MRHSLSMEREGDTIFFTNTNLSPTIVVDLPAGRDKSDVDREAFDKAEHIYRMVKRMYLIRDIINELEGMDMPYNRDDLEKMADEFEHHEDCSISYWENIGNAINEVVENQ